LLLDSFVLATSQQSSQQAASQISIRRQLNLVATHFLKAGNNFRIFRFKPWIAVFLIREAALLFG
jgi:hypothetical protein